MNSHLQTVLLRGGRNDDRRRIMKRIKICVFGLLVLLMFAAAGALAAPVTDTGQTTCYDADGNVIPCPSPGQDYYGQDANYTINPAFLHQAG